MPETFEGKVQIKPSTSGVTIPDSLNASVILDGNNGNLRMGGSQSGQGGDVILFPSNKSNSDPNNASISLNASDGSLRLGGNESAQDGDILIFPNNKSRSSESNASIHLSGSNGDLRMGGASTGQAGDIFLFPSDKGRDSGDSNASVYLSGSNGNLRLGGAGSGHDGDIFMFPLTKSNSNNNNASISLGASDGSLKLGGIESEINGDIFIFPDNKSRSNNDNATIHLDGASGDILLNNADCAEDFNVLESEEIEPGAVLVVEQEDTLRLCEKAYDKRVAGVVSGAGNLRPGIVLDKRHSENKRVPVALMGKVYCKVDAQYSPIEIGDLLTTSPTSGHAMKAIDHVQSFGCVIGKALSSLKTGKGLVKILIALQ